MASNLPCASTNYFTQIIVGTCVVVVVGVPDLPIFPRFEPL